jgi:protein KRI1
MPDSLRQKSEKRKEKRQEKKENKRLEIERNKQEVALLKKAKKEEILQRIQKIEEVGGKRKNSMEEEHIEKLIKEDFDPKIYEEKMREMFGEEFYQEEEGDEQEKELKGFIFFPLFYCHVFFL